GEAVDWAGGSGAGRDFADLFEVKDALEKKGKYSARVEDGRLLLGYERETYGRATIVSATAPARVDKKGLTFKVRLEPHGSWTTELQATVVALIGARTCSHPGPNRPHPPPPPTHPTPPPSS